MVLNEGSAWGIHKGVRPTNIVLKLLDKGFSEEYAKNHMKEMYAVSDKKINLCMKVALEERKLLKEIDYKDGYSLYVGIPFCPSICAYCSFSSTPVNKNPEMVERYLDALLEEIDFSAYLFKDRKLTTVYMGGGTPTSITAVQIDRVLDRLFEKFPIHENTEFTFEAGRPDSIDIEKLKVIKKYGINRISINPQSMKQETLDIIGRRHSVTDVDKAFLLAREEGFENINMDMIIGLPGENIKDVEFTLGRIEKLNPESLTVHSLAMKRAADFTTRREDFEEYSFNNSDEIMDLTYTYAEEMGMKPYYLYRQKNMVGNMENIGYAKQGKAGLYNILIMEELQSILALGAGAITKIVTPEGKIIRTDNVKSIEHYIRRIDEMKKRKRDLLCLKKQN